MLTLPISEPWFSMILSGEKKEEYRENKWFWRSRFENIGLLENGKPTDKEVEILFRNGYSIDCPYFCATCTMSFGTGLIEWGATPRREYLKLKICKITEICIPEERRVLIEKTR